MEEIITVPEQGTGQEEKTQAAEQQDQQQGKTFTQEDVNNLIARETKAAQEKLIKSLGFEDIKNVKDGLSQLQQWKDSQKTEAEKQQEQLQQAIQQAQALEEEKNNVTAQLEALKVGVQADFLEEALILARAKVSESVTIGDALKEVVEKFPQFKGVTQQQEAPKPSFTAGGNPQTNVNSNDPFQAILNKYKK